MRDKKDLTNDSQIDTLNVSKEELESEYLAAKQLFETGEYQRKLAVALEYMVSEGKYKQITRVFRKLLLEPMDKLGGQEIPIDHKLEKELMVLCKEIMYAKAVVFKKQMSEVFKEGENTDGN